MNMAIPSKRVIEIHWSKYIQRNCMKIKWQKLLHWQSNLLKNFTSMHEVFTNSQRSVLILIFCCDHYQKYIHLLHLCPLCNEMDCNNLSDSSSKEMLFSFLLSRLWFIKFNNLFTLSYPHLFQIWYSKIYIMFPLTQCTIHECKTGNNVSEFTHSNCIMLSYYSSPNTRVWFLNIISWLQ